MGFNSRQKLQFSQSQSLSLCFMCSDQQVKYRLPRGFTLLAVCYWITTLNNTYTYIRSELLKALKPRLQLIYAVELIYGRTNSVQVLVYYCHTWSCPIKKYHRGATNDYQGDPANLITWRSNTLGYCPPRSSHQKTKAHTNYSNLYI